MSGPGEWPAMTRSDDQKFRGLLEAAPDAMIAVDDRGTIVLVNTQTEKMFGYSRDEVLGKTIEILIPARLRGTHASHRLDFFAEPRVRPMGKGLTLIASRK